MQQPRANGALLHSAEGRKPAPGAAVRIEARQGFGRSRQEDGSASEHSQARQESWCVCQCIRPMGAATCMKRITVFGQDTASEAP